MKDKVDDLQYENLQPIAKVLKRKTATMKTLKKEIAELEANTENMSQIINKATCFEIFCKTKLNVFNRFLGKHTGRGHNDNGTKTVNTVNLPKLEISKFNGDSTKGQTFFNSFQAAIVKSTNLTEMEKLN